MEVDIAGKLPPNSTDIYVLRVVVDLNFLWVLLVQLAQLVEDGVDGGPVGVQLHLERHVCIEG